MFSDKVFEKCRLMKPGSTLDFALEKEDLIEVDKGELGRLRFRLMQSRWAIDRAQFSIVRNGNSVIVECQPAAKKSEMG